jgi:hypothetical protein
LPAGGLAGCEGPSRQRTHEREELATGGGAVIALDTWADWDDVDAALDLALSKAELAVLNTTSSDDRRTWTLVAMSNAQGVVTATRSVTGGRDPRGCERLRVEAMVDGPGGNTRAATLMDHLAARLEKLAGVDWAPVE